MDVARDEKGGQLRPDSRFGTARVAPAACSLDEIDGEGRTDVTRDERLLDVVPGRSLPGPGSEEAAKPRHEAAARPLEAGVEPV